MAIPKKLQEHLDKEGVKYEVAKHPLAYTAAEVAGAQHVPGKKMVKSVIAKAGKAFFMCVIPAIYLVDFEKLKRVVGNDAIELATEEDLKKLFPECEIGAEPPFGHLFGLKVYSDKILEQDEEIVFNAGTHTDVIKIKYADFKRLVNPVVAAIGSHI